MDIQNLLNDIENNEYLKLVFDYRYSKEYIMERSVPDLIENPRWEGQSEVSKKINWLYGSSDSLYDVIGVLNDIVWFVDSEGDMDKADCDLYNLPFRFVSSPFEDDWKQMKNMLFSFLYYFNYCEKNKIILKPENYQWKKELEKNKKELEKNENEFIHNLVNASEETKDFFQFVSLINVSPEIKEYDKNLNSPQWVFHSKNEDYNTVGIDGIYVCVIDNQGKAYKTDFDIYDFPFYVNKQFRVDPNDLDEIWVEKFDNYRNDCINKKISLSYKLHDYYLQIPKDKFKNERWL